MNMKELKKQIKELQKRVALLEGGCKRWKAGYGETYYYICGDGDIGCNTDENGETSTNRHNLGNYFQTEEEAKKTVEKLKIYIQLKDLALRLNNGEEIDWKNAEQAKYSIVCDIQKNKKLNYMYTSLIRDIGQIYCLDENFLDIAKQAIGEVNLKKLFE